jgi:hypothetical protein
MKPCDEILLKTIEMASDMLKLADQGDANREDNGCGVLYGLVRDCAYRIRRVAEAEKEAHDRKSPRGEAAEWNPGEKGDP